MLGWPRFSRAAPHAGHRALVQLERQGHVLGIITQNVDGLHQTAGNLRVIELHGALSQVRCLRCDEPEPRAALQARLEALNPQLFHVQAALAPDGDADLSREWLREFRVANCLSCDGVLKPNVVFFGENVPRDRVHAAAHLVGQAEALLVLGSSLAVFSGYRFVKRAHELGRPIGLVTLGETRADALVDVRVDAKLMTVLPELARVLLGEGGPC
jgi:NAD-dependent SIR2 family protein deacetylase